MSDQPPLVPPGPSYEPPPAYQPPPAFGASWGAPAPTVEERPELAEQLRSAAIDAGVIVAWFVVLGILGAFIWWQVTPLAAYTRTRDNGILDEEQLGKQFASDGWFFFIAVAGGLLSGAVLGFWRRRDPVLTVILLAFGGALATFVMIQAGLVFGPADPTKVLPTVAIGAKVPLQLKTSAHTVWFAWSTGAMFGALAVLWIGADRRPVDSPGNPVSTR